MTIAIQRSVRVLLGVGAIALTIGAFAVVPTAAHAADGVSSRLQYGCTLFDEDGSTASEEPAGVEYTGNRVAGNAVPSTHWLSASASAIYPEGAPLAESCAMTAEWGDQLTVGAGTSGLAQGTRVPVTVVVHLDGALAETWDGDGQFGTEASYRATASVVSLDDCESAEGCETPLDFSAVHTHTVSGGPATGDVEATGKREHTLATNVEGQGSESFADESRPGRADDTPLCPGWPCDSATHQVHPDGQGPQVLYAQATLVVGHHYRLGGTLNVFGAANRNGDVQGSATVNEFWFRLDPAPGSEGIDLRYASDATPAPADTAPPVFHGVQDVTVPAGPDGNAVVDYPFTVTDDVDPAPTVACTPPSGTTFHYPGFPILCHATDAAGNTAEAHFTVTLVDQTPPVFRPLPDLTATAGPGGTAVVTWTAGADDNSGNATVACNPASGSAFPVGRTTVTCAATDGSGNASADTFLVTVAPAPGDVMDHLREVIRTAHTSQLIRAVLLVMEGAADTQLDAGHVRAGCSALTVLDTGISLLSGHGIPAAEATTMRNLIYEARITYCH